MGNSHTEFHEKILHCAFVKILEQKESIFPNGNQGNECNRHQHDRHQHIFTLLDINL